MKCPTVCTPPPNVTNEQQYVAHGRKEEEVVFLEGDDFHPPANREKMKAGLPLNDDDRFPWLRAIASAINE